jgi:hypothetical protein
MLFMCTLKKINLGYLILFLTKMSKYAEGEKTVFIAFLYIKCSSYRLHVHVLW